MRLSFCQAIAAAVFSAVCGSSASTAATYMQFDVPHAVGGTFPTSINANGDVVGNFVDAGGDTHGFVRKANGIIKTFDAQDGLPTFPTAINDVGTVAGFYHLDRADNASFVRAPNGKIETFKAPGNTAVTVADAIDSKGTITGSYFDFDAYADFAFIRSPQGKFKRFSANKDGSTIPCCLDEAGIIAGTQIIYNGAHGFVREKGGDIAIFDVPGTSGDTLVNARSEPGWIAGYYTVSLSRHKFVYRGFVRAPDESFATFEFSEQGNTQPCCVDANGTAAGTYNIKGQSSRGFLRTSDGHITSFRVPGKTTGTFATAMNLQDAIAGYFLDADGTHGFLRIP